MIRLTKVVPLDRNRLSVTFADGHQGVCDISDLIHGRQFNALSDVGFFRHVAIDPSGAAFWPNGADICADLLYKLAKPTARDE